MSTTCTKHFRLRGHRGEICMSKSIWTQFVTYLYAVLITMLSFGVVLEGGGIQYVAGVLVIGMLCILMIYGVQIHSIKVGDWFYIKFESDDSKDTVVIDDRKEEEKPENKFE